MTDSSFEHVTKSGPKKTSTTPSIVRRRVARGEGRAERRSRNSWDDPPVTVTPGMNFREASLGVVSVWINIVRRCCNWRGVGDRLKGELFIIIAALGVDVAMPLAGGRACRAILADLTVVRDDEAISGRNSAADGLDIVI